MKNETLTTKASNLGLIPRYEYDCGHCKLAWCCGVLCACFPAKQLPVRPARRRLVRKLQAMWRKGGIDRKVANKLAQEAANRWMAREQAIIAKGRKR